MDSNNPAATQKQEDLDAELDALVERFLTQMRRGDHLSVESFADQHPVHRDWLLQILPTLLSLESCVEEDCHGVQSLPARVGEYEVLGLLGRGGMGVVYLARHPQLDRKVAIKVLPSHLTNDERVLKRFQREANAIAQLEHPNIVTLFELNCELSHGSDAHYFVMQYIRGASLDAVIRSQQSKDLNSNSAETRRADLSATKDEEPALPVDGLCNHETDILLAGDRWRMVAKIGADAADGLAHAHDREILHRDIKPSNLIIDSSGKTWIADFGLARLANEDASRTDGVAGTLRFIAPERFRGWTDPRSDIYSLGVTLYEVAVLQPAIRGNDRAEIIANIAKSRMKPPRQLCADIPRDLETILGKATAASPDDRYETAAAMADDLRRFLSLQPIKARRSTLAERTRQWARRNPSVATLLASVALLLVALTFGSSFAAYRFNEMAKEIQKRQDAGSRSLLQAYINESHAHSTSNRPGQRTAALRAVKNGVELLPDVAHEKQDVLQLRNEMIAALTLPDLEFVREVRTDYAKSTPSPDFKYIASSAQDGLFRCRDAVSGRVLLSYQFQGGELNATSGNQFSPDSRYVVAFSYGTGRVRMFECESGELMIDYQGQPLGIDPAEPVGFDGNSRMLAICCHGKPIHLYDVRRLSEPPAEIEVPFPVTRAFFHGEKELIAYTPEHRSGDLVVVNLETQETKVVTTPFRSAVSWRAVDGGVVVGCDDGTVARVDWPYIQRTRFSKTREKEARYVETSVAANLMAVKCWGGDFHVSDTRTGNALFSLWGERAKFSRTGRSLALSDGAKMRFYRVHSNRRYVQTAALTHLGDHCIRLNRKGDQFLATSWTELQLWNANDLRITKSADYHGLSPAARFLSDDGRAVAIVDGKLALLDLADDDGGEELGRPKFLGPAFPNWLSAADESDRIAWQPNQHSLRIGDISNLDDAVELRPRNAAAHPYFELSPDGKLLAIADGTVRLFDADTAQLIHDFGIATRGTPRTYFQYRPDGRQLICHTGAEQLLIDLQQKRIVQRFSADGHLGGADWSPDGKTLARAVNSETILLQDATTLVELARIRLHDPMGIRTIRFSRDGSSLLGCVHGVQIHRWDLRAIRQELAQFGLDW